jgi:tetratricopeptide (TPR) repeat protein
MKKASILAIFLLCLASVSISFGQGPMQAKPSAEDQARLIKLEKAYKAAKAKLAKAPHDAKAKADFANIGAAYGHESMVSPVLAPRVKYPQALHIYREVLKVDPNQKTAKDESNLIISIYKQMGRPVPQG